MVRGITSAYRPTCSRASSKSLVFFNRPFLVPQPHSCWRPILDLSKPSLSETIRTSLQQGEWGTLIDFKDAYFHIPIQEQVGESQIPPGLSLTYTGTSKNVSATGLAGEVREIRAGAQTRLRFFRLPVRPQVWLGPTDSGPVAEPSREKVETAIPTGLPGLGIHVLDRFTNRPTLCPTMENLVLVCQETSDSKARHFPGRLNVVADKLSRLGQIIQTEWFLLPEVFYSICSRWHRPKIDLFATRFNNKLPLFVSPVPDPLVTAVDALSLPW